MARFVIAWIVVAVLLLANSAAASDSGWSIEKTPDPGGSQLNFLNGVSCPSASACTAVGNYSPAATSGTLAERWNGTKWSVEPTPASTGRFYRTVWGVSCVSASACTAVGHDQKPSIDQRNGPTLAERWNGTKWSIQHTPNPTGSFGSHLYGVSCVSASACTAVGYYEGNTSGTLTERWNGTKWSIQHTPTSTGGSASRLSGVSCTSASACTAVGVSSSGTLAERWNGTKWSIERTPNPAGGGGSLSGVSCASAKACTAVGYYSTGVGEPTALTLAESWNGARWSIEHTPNPTGSSYSPLYAVSCASPSACTAVGDDTNRTANVTFAERWNGTNWSIQYPPNPTRSSNGLSGVSCASASSCTAVGEYYNGTRGTEVTFAERWNGTG